MSGIGGAQVQPIIDERQGGDVVRADLLALGMLADGILGVLGAQAETVVEVQAVEAAQYLPLSEHSNDHLAYLL